MLSWEVAGCFFGLGGVEVVGFVCSGRFLSFS